jgi:hypothetical protein
MSNRLLIINIDGDDPSLAQNSVTNTMFLYTMRTVLSVSVVALACVLSIALEGAFAMPTMSCVVTAFLQKM